jgi:maleamate amidohydrolase
MARVWDPFLTEQDRAHIARQPKKPIGFGDRAALLMIDNYRKAVGDEPEPLLEAIETWPASTGLAGWKALDSIAVLLAAGRAAGLPVVHLTALTEAESGVAPWTARTNFWREPAKETPEERSRFVRATEIVDQAAPMPGEAVLRKTAPSGFSGTPLAAHLAALGVDTLIVGGEATSGCVRATVVDAVSYRYRVVVVEDCVYDSYEAAHAINLFDMHRKYADVLALADVVEWIRNSAETDR